MGEVYKARDPRLNRTVAIKVLKADVAADAGARARFEREARAIAALSHPHICTIHDVGREGDTDYLVMEYLEGETLDARLASGARLPAAAGPGPKPRAQGLPLSDVLTIGIAIADALDKAHRAGITHRDLKPANVMLTKTGPKLLDFGLAKLRGSASPVVSMMDPSGDAGTTAVGPATAKGTILGTIHYMAPEQVEGREADTRSDIWALGALLYEMATGQRPFDGESAASVIGAILKDTPPAIATRQPLTPSSLEHLVERCLEKDPDERWQDVRDVKRELTWIAGDRAREPTSASTLPGQASSRPASRVMTLLQWVLGASIGAALSAAFLVGGKPATAVHPMRFVITTPSDASIRSANQPGLSVSPDGSRIVYRNDQGKGLGGGRLYVRAIDQLEAVPLRVVGPNQPVGPIFSRDGAWVAYHDFADGTLKRVSSLGGPPETICSLSGGALRGASWGPDGTIVFATDRSHGLLRVPAAGGTPQRLSTAETGKGLQEHWWPEVLPDGRAVIFTVWSGDPQQARVAVMQLPGGPVTGLFDGMSPHFVPTGHVVFAAADRTLRAVGFDAARLQAVGSPVKVVDRVGVGPDGSADFAVAEAGSLVYSTEPSGVVTPRTLVWVDRSGHEEPLNVPVRAYTYARLSPDGTRIALDSRDEQNDIWIWDLARKTLQRLTTDPGKNRQPAWTPDGTRVAFSAERDGVESVYWQAFDGSGTMERLSSGTDPQFPGAFSPGGTEMIFMTPSAPPYDLGLITLGPPRTSRMLLHSVASENNGEISPDGHWLAYDSDESGRSEVYVRPFPNIEAARRQVSTGGGTRPLWSTTGRELFYYVGPDTIMAVPVRLGSEAILGTPQPAVKGAYAVPVNTGRHYDVSRDGQRFLLLKDASQPDGRQPLVAEIHVVLNWLEELKAKVPTK